MKDKFIVENINKMSKEHHIEIFKIISNNSIKYTENNNGIFINYNDLNEKCINDIENYIKYILENNINMKKHEEKKMELINSI
jgi:hypothetical protein